MANNVIAGACPSGSKKGSRGSHLDKLRFALWNIGTLMGKSIELVKVLHRRRISIACVQETKWVGAKVKEIDGYKLWYLGLNRAKNGVDILVGRDLAEQVVDVRRKSDRIITTRYRLFGDRKFRSQNSNFRSLITIGDRIETENFRSQNPWSQIRNRDQNFSIRSLMTTGPSGL